MVADSPERPLVWLSGEVRTPPFSLEARIEAGELLRRLQQGENLAMPRSRPMSVIGPACHELRIVDAGVNWRIVYHLRVDAVVILTVFAKRTRKTPAREIESNRDRLRRFLRAVEGR